jgi:prepilin-type N-terminal cleavage/methylation domain-containing protein
MKRPSPSNNARGFTLLEMLVAMGVFLVISAAALSLFAAHQTLFNRQQNFSAMNITIRNAVSQLQLDVVNAGTGYYPGTNIPDWPVGITVSNSNPSSACNTPSTYTYSSSCFDTLNLITTDPNTPAAHLDNGTFTFTSSDCVASTSSPIYVYPPSGTTAATLASDYKSGDELLLVDTANSKITTIKLSSAPTTYTSGSNTGVKLAFSVTNSDGTNSTTNDPLGITTTSGNPKLNTSFCSTDWIMRLQPITYEVDTSTASDPKLDRIQGGVTSILAEQVIGFKIGAVAWNVTDDTTPYSYVSSNSSTANPVGYSNEWWLVRSVQISLIGRTTPVTDPTYTYRNGFDEGPYQIESAMIVVNPRNLSMNNN